MKKLRIYAILILASIAISRTHADIGHLYTGNQMSSSLIECVTQDKHGFIWVGTEYGLNKFDGYRFTTYLSDPNDSTSLVGNEVVRLLSDSQGRLWVGTHTGIARFDYERNQFQRYTFPHRNGRLRTVQHPQGQQFHHAGETVQETRHG